MKKRILPILLITVAVAALIAYIREMKASLSNRGDKYGFRSESPD